MDKTGKFIVFEGIDGSGKTIQSKLLTDRLNENGYGSVHTNEPTNQLIGKYIRDILSHSEKVHGETLALIFAADRYEHISNFIIPNLNAGHNVICDRFVYSSYAYQSTASDLKNIIEYNRKSMEKIQPDCIFFIDVPVEVCLERLSASRQSLDIFETKNQLISIKNNYENYFNKEKCSKIERIDGEPDMDKIADIIYNITVSAIL